MGHGEHRAGVLCLHIQHELQDILTLGGQTPDLDDIPAGIDDRLILFLIHRAVPGIVLPVAAELGIHVGAFHVDAVQILAIGIRHRSPDLAHGIHKFFGVHAEIQCRQNGGGAVLQVVTHRLGIVVEEDLAVGMGVDVHETRANIQAFGIDHFTTFGDLQLPGFAESLDDAILHEKHAIGDQMVPHNQSRVLNCNHVRYLPYVSDLRKHAFTYSIILPSAQPLCQPQKPHRTPLFPISANSVAKCQKVC